MRTRQDKRVWGIFTFVVLLWVALFVLFGTIAKSAERSGTWLQVTAAPRISTQDLMKSVYVSARIKGEETEEWYCPAYELWLNGDRVSSRESDCPPFAEREEFPRQVIYHISRIRGQYRAEVRLIKTGKILARNFAEWEVF